MRNSNKINDKLPIETIIDQLKDLNSIDNKVNINRNRDEMNKKIILNLILNVDITNVDEVIKNINGVYLRELIQQSVLIYESGKLTTKKLMNLFSNILVSNSLKTKEISYLFNFFVRWMVNYDNPRLITNFFSEMIENLSHSTKIHEFLIHNGSSIILKYDNKILVNLLVNSVYSSTNSLKISKRVINFIYLLLVSIFNKKYRFKSFNFTQLSFDEQNLMFYLIGRLLNDTNIDFLNSFPALLDIKMLNLFKAFDQHIVLYRLLHAQPAGLNYPQIISKIIFGFSSILVNKYGFQKLFEIFSRWYIIEQSSSYRYSFHLTYIRLIKMGQNAEMTLNFVCEIINLETDPEILLNVFKKLYSYRISWGTLYLYLITPYLRNCYQNENENENNYKKNLKHIFLMYKTDLSQSLHVKLLSETEDLFLAFWVSLDKERFQLFPYLQKWIIDDRNNKSKTVKAALIKSLINQSDDDYWGHKLELIFQNFGTLSVQIIENERLDTIRVLQDHSKNISLKTKNLQSEYNGLFCMGCKKSFDSNKIANCQVCKFIFCNSCSNTWERYNTEDLCLGSVMMSQIHKFVVEK